MSRTLKLILLTVLLAALLFAARGLYRDLVKNIDVETVSVPTTPEVVEETETTEVDETMAPDFRVYDAEGNEVTLSGMRGRPVVLNFWASWCPPCKAELPDFDAAFRANPDICFMMVNLTDGASETMETASDFIESNGYGFPVYYDTDYDAANAYGVMSIPMTVFIDAEGHVRTYSVGMISAETLAEGIALIR